MARINQWERGFTMATAPVRAEIGVFGGSGFYSLFSHPAEVKVDTPYGPSSDLVTLGEVRDKVVAFIPRHGRKHTIPPHMINYRANLWAMKELGVTRIIAPFACGSLQTNLRPGDFVVVDQFVDRTCGRADTFFNGPKVSHISSAEPYCPELRQLAVQVLKSNGITTHDGGAVVVIQGPRFSTKAESRWFTKCGWELVNMTQYPEVVLAQELGMCVTGIGLVTDYDAGLAGNVPEVTAAEVARTFHQNSENLRRIMEPLIAAIPAERKNCRCAEKPAEAMLG